MGRILIIDDDKTDRLFIKKALMKERDTLEFIELEQGFEAVNTIKDNQPLATIVDVRMPGLDGFEVLKMIRTDPELADHIILMLSGSEEPDDIEMARASGADAYLTKPGSISGYKALAKTIFEHILGKNA